MSPEDPNPVHKRQLELLYEQIAALVQEIEKLRGPAGPLAMSASRITAVEARLGTTRHCRLAAIEARIEEVATTTESMRLSSQLKRMMRRVLRLEAR